VVHSTFTHHVLEVCAGREKTPTNPHERQVPALSFDPQGCGLDGPAKDGAAGFLKRDRFVVVGEQGFTSRLPKRLPELLF
jgi:hypothetical protein